MKKTLQVLMFLLVMSYSLSCRVEQTKSFRQEAVDYAVAEYGVKTKGMKESSAERKKGLIVTVENPRSKDKAMYWVMFKEVTPVFAGVPQPEKKWKRLSVLGITGPKYGGWACMWGQKLSDEEFRALSKLNSPKDILVRGKVVQTVIAKKVLPESATEWHKGQFFARATEAQAFTFEFETKASLGGNLMGITVYIDKDGTVITKYEEMLFSDGPSNKPDAGAGL